jgi:hypothetical protein
MTIKKEEHNGITVVSKTSTVFEVEVVLPSNYRDVYASREALRAAAQRAGYGWVPPEQIEVLPRSGKIALRYTGDGQKDWKDC